MTVRARRGVFVTAVGIAVVGFALAMWPPMASSGVTVRPLDIVVRDMAFYVDGNAEPNPVITLRSGERVRVRVRNEDAGTRHNFTIKAWTVGTKMLDDDGKEDVVEFRVPAERGTQTYQCTPHPKMMTGTIRVE